MMGGVVARGRVKVDAGMRADRGEARRSRKRQIFLCTRRTRTASLKKNPQHTTVIISHCPGRGLKNPQHIVVYVSHYLTGCLH